ncbi:hypothetical protein FRB90_005740 [Tulasnella sp. 427]|nr:hypothetical protein FRB90_005740 [Tulasnella sp. 427]
MDAGPSNTLNGDSADVSGGLFYHPVEELPLKFHIQKHIGPIDASLRKLIAEHGGEVIKAVPIKGYVLIDPDSEKGNALLAKWQDETKPDRHIVCHTFVPTCIAVGAMVSPSEMHSAIPLFTISGHPAEIYLHPSLGHERRQQLTKDITKFGGTITSNANLAQVLICDNANPSFDTLARKYAHNNNVYVEPPTWVKTCIGRRTYEHDQPVQKPIGGIPRGSKNQDRFDVMIDAWVESNPQPVMGKGQYVVSMKKGTPNPSRASESPPPAEEDNGGEESERPSNKKERRKKHKDKEDKEKRPRKKRRVAKPVSSSDDEDATSAEALMTQMISGST